jgi:hypothetical protein
MRLVTSDGEFALPLFHATSDYFADMIMRTGLGAQNVIRDWRVIECAREILAILDEQGIGGSLDSETYGDVLMFRITCNQEVSGG